MQQIRRNQESRDEHRRKQQRRDAESEQELGARARRATLQRLSDQTPDTGAANEATAFTVSNAANPRLIPSSSYITQLLAAVSFPALIFPTHPKVLDRAR